MTNLFTISTVILAICSLSVGIKVLSDCLDKIVSGNIPSFTSCANFIIFEPSAWRCIFVNLVVFISFESIRSFSTCPGPTLGNWSTSPTIMILASGCIEVTKYEASDKSIIDASSTIISLASVLLYLL